ALLVLLALLVAVPAAVAAPGPALSVLVHHPFPDPADPLGAPFPLAAGDAGFDAFVTRYAAYDVDGDGFAYPSVVVDGVVPIEGLPDGDRPFASTQAAYTAAVDQQEEVEAAVTLAVATEPVGDQLGVEIRVAPLAALPDERLRLWVALAEDHVHYEPPPALSNGVTDHRFTVRAVIDLGRLDLAAGGAVERNTTFAMDEAWDRDQLFVTAWVQQEPSHGLRFQAREVVQATTHPALQVEPTVQETKGVLLELLSAAWCDPCLFGDRVVDELAEERGHAAFEPTAAGPATTYWRAPEQPLVVVGAGLVGAFLLGRRWRPSS
ncbi:MAG: hypothetical protein ACPGQL_09775, partial [Thermoplasmatota archaeon]